MENRVAIKDPPIPLVFTPPMQFAMYDGHIPYSSIRLGLIEVEAERRGDRRALGYAPALRLEYLLEFAQPFPGDPFNVLQFRGPRFTARQMSTTEIMVYDNVFDTSDIVPVMVASNDNFAAARWYAQLRRQRSVIIAELDPSFGMTVHAPDVWSWSLERKACTL